jgi:predicted 3-demethylubiquinone-9 3-methyltransferase (glyoxalase superfamily)
MEQKITPFLWFDTEAEEAANFYVSLFNGNPGRKTESKLGSISRYPEEGREVTGKPAGSVMVAEFILEGQTFNALNGGPGVFKMSGAISFVINCKTQEEVDYFWENLSNGGEAGQCGWINHDKFGVTWQVVPDALGKLLSDTDKVKANRVMAAMLKMTKIDISALERAHQGL